MSAPNGSVSVEQRGGAIALVLRGDVDLAVVGRDDASRLITQVSDQAVADVPVAVDLTEVRFMDSSGLGFLVHLRNALPGGIELIGIPTQVGRLLEVTGLSSVLTGPAAD